MIGTIIILVIVVAVLAVAARGDRRRPLPPTFRPRPGRTPEQAGHAAPAARSGTGRSWHNGAGADGADGARGADVSGWRTRSAPGRTAELPQSPRQRARPVQRRRFRAAFGPDRRRDLGIARRGTDPGRRRRRHDRRAARDLRARWRPRRSTAGDDLLAALGTSIRQLLQTAEHARAALRRQRPVRPTSG